jgi:hypothetical protein
MNTGQNEEGTMNSKTFRIAGMIVLASFALSSAASIEATDLRHCVA